MNRQAILILVLLAVTVVVSAQDTLYYNTNNKRVTSMDSASTYRIYTMDKIREGILNESVYFKSGNLKSTCSLILQFKKDAKKAIIESYNSGKVSWNDPSIEKHMLKLIDGTYNEWYENGQVRKEVEYKEGKMNGHYTSYWENGQIKRVEFFDSIKSVEGKCFDPNGKEIKHTPIAQMPEFPGGVDNLMSFLSQNIKYPIDMMEDKVQGKVIAQFTVGKDGSLSDIKIARSLHPAGDKEAIRVISIMPKWTPGIKEDELVSVRYTLPINFRMMKSDNVEPFRTRNANRQF